MSADVKAADDKAANDKHADQSIESVCVDALVAQIKQVADLLQGAQIKHKPRGLRGQPMSVILQRLDDLLHILPHGQAPFAQRLDCVKRELDWLANS